MGTEKTEVTKIGTFTYKKRIVPIFFDPYTDSDTIMTNWQASNPDAFYSGPCFMGPNGITYPEGVEVKQPTAEDRKRVCRFIIVGKRDIDNFQDDIHRALEKGDIRHNR